MLQDEESSSSQRPAARVSASLYAESHDGVDNVVVILLERLDGLLPRDASLLHDQLDVLGLEAGLVDLLAVILLLLLLLLLDGRRLALAVVVALVVVALVLTGSLGLSELLGSGSLGSGVQVLDLGLTEDAASVLLRRLEHGLSRDCLHPGVAVGGLVDIGVVDDEEDLCSTSQPKLQGLRVKLAIALQWRGGPGTAAMRVAQGCRRRRLPWSVTHVLGPAESDAGDALDVLQAELRNGLAGLLLVARVDGNLSTGGDAGVAGALVARLGAGLLIGNLGDLLLGLVGELFDTGVGHGGRIVWWSDARVVVARR